MAAQRSYSTCITNLLLLNIASLAAGISAGCEKTDKIPPRAHGNSHSCWMHPGQLWPRTEGITLGTTTGAHPRCQYSPFSSTFTSLCDIVLWPKLVASVGLITTCTSGYLIFCFRCSIWSN